MKKRRFNGVSRTTCLEIYSSLSDCPRALTCYLLMKYHEDKQLVSLDWKPEDYNSLVSARDSLLATKLASKATFVDTSIDTSKVAKDAFFKAEEVCHRTNVELRNKLISNNLFATLYSIAQRKILLELGEFDIEEMLGLCGWGPGATRGIARRQATVTNKFRLEDEITQSASDLFGCVFDMAYPLWRKGRTFKHVSSNRVVTVPKNAKTDRTIAIEPGLNLWLQKGVGKVIRERLRRRGNDLRYQSHNQRLSRIGSKFNTLATIDFSMASDTISQSVISELLPRDWELVLRSLRAVVGLYDSVPITYSKFSSMGNGFTFELETLIFRALALASCEYLGIETDNVSVYGDDVILPVQAADLFISVCEFSGFTINKSKSYSSSYYRESCGKHYWNGIDITPLYIKEDVNDESSLYKLANGIRRLAHRRNSYGCDRALLSSWSSLVELSQRKLMISDGFGDGGLIVNFDEATPSKARYGHEGFFTKHFSPIPITAYYDDHSILLTRLYELGSSEVLESSSSIVGSIPRNNEDYFPGRHKVRVQRLLIPLWTDLGPWI